MEKRAVLLAVFALTLVGGTAHGSNATPATAPFAQSWSHIPRTQAARRASDTMVFGQEQDIDGFNGVLTCCNQFWAGVQEVPVIRGAYNVDNKLRHVLDLVTSAKA